MDRPLVIAHRGDSAHAPENTLPAFEAAVAKGADWIELDLQLSRDDEVVVCHDDELTRLAGSPARLRDLDARTLAATDVGGRLFPAFAGTGVPSLRQVLDTIGSRVPLYLELKSSGRGRRDRDAALLLQKCLQLVPRHAPHALASFDAGLVRGALEDGRRAVLIVSDPQVVAKCSARELHGLFAVSVRHDAIDDALARRVLDGGPYLWAWTLHEDRPVRAALKRGVSGICGNDVAALRALADKLPASRGGPARR